MKLSWPWARKEMSSTQDLYKELLLQAGSKSGVAVNWKTASQASAAIACARVIAEGIAQVPFKLYRERPGGGMDAARTHGLYDLLASKPNDWQTSFELREMIGLHLAFMGRAHLYKVRGTRGEVLELLPFEPQNVETIRTGWEISYRVRLNDGRMLAVAKEDMWHLRGISWDGVNGLEGIKLAREAIGLSLAMEEHGARMFSNGARPAGALIADGNLKEDQIKLIKQSWEDSYGGNANAFKTAVLFGGLKWNPFSMTGVDAQHLEQRRFQVEEICRYFRVLPNMVGHFDKGSTYASSEQNFLAHVVHTLMPWYARIEASADVNLLDDAERREGYYFKFTAQALMRGASKDRAEYFAKALGSGGSPAWMTQDEVRALEEMNPMGGSAGVLPIPTNVGGAPSKPTGEPDNENPA
ncbi:phage portal protein [Methylovorus menthalis]|uniref:phage portal protein n=1 Tax=Methylovorus menthalis TaxID=1002227 RepID=UPI001E5053B7|nr:phage portal protein [Methylovorus menthalis]MCB4811687.1 phage portal protein [Methylovorus menthalis]